MNIIMVLAWGRWIVGDAHVLSDTKVSVTNPCEWQPQIQMDSTGRGATITMLVPLPVTSLRFENVPWAPVDPDLATLYSDLIVARRSKIVRPPSGLTVEGGHRRGT